MVDKVKLQLKNNIRELQLKIYMEPDIKLEAKTLPIKNQNYIIIDKYVEIGNQPQTFNNNKKAKDKLNIEEDDVQRIRQHLLSLASLQMDSNLEQAAARTQFVKQKIAPLNHKQTDQFGKILNESIINYYHDRIKRTKQTEKNMRDSIQTFIILMTSFKDCSVSFTISNVTLTLFKKFWQNCLLSQNSTQYMSNELLNAWRYIPYQLLDTFLKDFELVKLFHLIDIEKFFAILSVCFFQNKIQQGCQYYRLFKQGRTLTKKQLQLFESYQYEHIVPRISKKDQLFSQYVISLIKNDKDIASKMFKILQINEYQKIIKLTGKNIEDHPQIIEHSMKKQYHDIARRNREWYIIQDKISFSPQYIKWFTEDIKKQFDQNSPEKDENQNDKKQSKCKFDIRSSQEADVIINSMLVRANLLKKQEKQLVYLQNPLYLNDDYIPAQYILTDLDPINKKINQTYLTLEHFGIKSQDIIFVDAINQTFNQATSFLLSAEIVGFDSQFWATTNKYEEGGIAIIQLATQHKCYIFDYHSLKQYEQFDQFFINFMENDKITKVGHTVSSDLKFLYKTFNKEIKIVSMADLVQIFKKQYSNEVYSSLAYMSEKFIGKKMCKYEQRSNWNRRPLKKTQICYACLDAISCVEIYLQMQKQKVSFIDRDKKSSQNSKKKNKQKSSQNEQTKLTDDVFNYQKFKDFLENPIFLVDNMLKKLCTTMRNCGIDSQYISIKDYQLSMSQALKQKRIFITRDSKLSVKKFAHVPIYQLKEKGDSDIMFKQLIQVFNIDLSQYQTLSRCVKCNNPEIIIIQRDQAKKQINFVYQDSQISVFWRCTKCKQIYWQGGQFKKAKTKYQQLRK